MAKVITSVKDLTFAPGELQDMPVPGKVLLVSPEHFDVEYVINPHMRGHIGDVDKSNAFVQWKALRDAYQDLGLYVHEVAGSKGFPDMVFCANQSLPNIRDDGKKEVVMSVMNAYQRKGEVPFIQQVYEQSSYEIVRLDESKFKSFEGMGDAIWHFRRRLIWGGYGYRTSPDVYEIISGTFNTPVIALELINEKFYHLDTCLCILNEDTALIYPEAFTTEGLDLIEAMFPRVIKASQHEAENLFACNATCPDGHNVFIQQGCTLVNDALVRAGFNVHQFNTSEFLKSGGSVFCMKMLLW